MSAADPPGDAVTVLRCVTGPDGEPGGLASKIWKWLDKQAQWTRERVSVGTYFTAEEARVANLRELADLILRLRRDPKALIVRGELTEFAREKLARAPRKIRRLKHRDGSWEPTLREVARRWVMIDVDGWRMPAWADLATDPESVIEAYIGAKLPAAFHDAVCFWQLSASAGFAPGILKAHLFFWLAAPATNEHLAAVFEQHAPDVDRNPFNAALPHFIADPVIEGGIDPLPRRTGWRKGLEAEVELPALKTDWQRQRPSGKPGSGFQAASVEAAIASLGDGDGLAGFHEPLRAATWAYARECFRCRSARDDAALIARLQDVIRAATRDCAKRPSIANYLSERELQRYIAGAFGRLAADADLPVTTPYYKVPTQTPEEARAVLAEHIRGFMSRTLAWHADPARGEPEQAGLAVGTALGKTSLTIAELPGYIARQKAAGRPHRVEWFVPYHRLSDQTQSDMEKLGISAAVRRGREAPDPSHPDYHNASILHENKTAMCVNLERVKDAQAALQSVESSVCGNPKKGPTCPFYRGCSYQREKRKAASADVVILANTMLGNPKPAHIGDGFGLVVIDEGFWPALLKTHRLVRALSFADQPLHHPIQPEAVAPAHVDMRGDGNLVRQYVELAERQTQHLVELSQKAQSVFLDKNDGQFVSKARTLAAGLTVESCEEAIRLEWKRKVDGAMAPGLSQEAWKAAVRATKGNRAIPRRVAVWKALIEMLKGEATHTGRLVRGVVDNDDGAKEPAIYLNERREIHESWALPTLFTDATLVEETVRPFMPRLNVLANVQAAAPHCRITQVVGSFGKYALLPSERDNEKTAKYKRDRLAQIRDFTRFHGYGNAGVITHKAIEQEFAGPGFITAHFGATVGLNAMQHVRALFVIGRAMPSAEEVHRLALALTGQAIRKEKGHREVRGVPLRDGTGFGLSVSTYRDATLEAVRAAITDAGVVQDVGRARAVNRGAGNPVDIFLFCDDVVPALPVDQPARWDDLWLNAAERMVARGKVLLSPADAVLAYSDLFASAEAARKAIGRAGISRTFPYRDSSIKGCPLNRWAEVRYRPAGRGQQTRQAFVAPEHLDGFRAWLRELLQAPLALYEVTMAEPEPTPPEPPAPGPEAPAEPRTWQIVLDCPAPIGCLPEPWMVPQSGAPGGHVPRHS